MSVKSVLEYWIGKTFFLPRGGPIDFQFFENPKYIQETFVGCIKKPLKNGYSSGSLRQSLTVACPNSLRVICTVSFSYSARTGHNTSTYHQENSHQNLVIKLSWHKVKYPEGNLDSILGHKTCVSLYPSQAPTCDLRLNMTRRVGVFKDS